MNHCASNLCTQGRQPCPTPWSCGLSSSDLHRYMPPITKEGGATVEFEERRECPIPTPDDAMDWVWAGAQVLFFGIGVALFALAVNVIWRAWV